MDSLTFLGGPLDGQEMTVGELARQGAGVVIPTNAGLQWYAIINDGSVQHRVTTDLIVVEPVPTAPAGTF